MNKIATIGIPSIIIVSLVVIFLFRAPATPSTNNAANSVAALNTTTSETSTTTPVQNVSATNTAQDSTPTSTGANTIRLTQVAQHASASNCWMAINGNVYNVTSFISEHPGGDLILEGCGKDATTLFETMGGRGSHSFQAQQILDTLKIGTLAQ